MNQGIAESGGLWRSLLSIAAGLALAAVLMRVSGYHPAEAFAALWAGATGLQSGPPNGAADVGLHIGPFVAHLNTYQLANSLARMTPLLLTGLAVALGLRAGLFNIGAQGQMLIGALAAAAVGLLGGKSGLAPVVHIPLTLCCGALAGAAWGAVPGLLKALRGVHEVIATIMLNFVALYLAQYLVTHNLKDTASSTMSPQSPLMAKSAWLPPFVPNANLTAGFVLAILAAFAVSLLIRRTALGYEIRAVGQGADAARAAGIPVAGILVKTMALSGALAGLAGAIEVMGLHHRYVPGAAGNYGFDGIAVALLGGLNGGGIVFSAAFFGLLESGAQNMQLLTDVPDTIATIVQAVVIVFIGIRWRRKIKAAVTAPGVPNAAERQG